MERRVRSVRDLWCFYKPEDCSHLLAMTRISDMLGDRKHDFAILSDSLICHLIYGHAPSSCLHASVNLAVWHPQGTRTRGRTFANSWCQKLHKLKVPL